MKKTILNDKNAMIGTLSHVETKEDMLNCSWAEVQVKTPKCIVKSMQKSICGNNTYPEISIEFYNSIIQKYKNEYNLKLEKKNIELSPGIITGIALLIKAYTKEQDKIAVLSCEYPNIHKVVYNHNRICEKVPFLQNEQGRYEINWKKLEEKMKIAKMFIFSNPQNPTGEIFSREELTKIHEIATKNNVFVITDECHESFVWGEKIIPYYEISKGHNSASFISPGKAFSLSGLMVGTIISNENAIEKFNLEFDKLHLVKSKMAAIAIEAAYTKLKAERYLIKLKEEILINKKLFIKTLKKEMPEVKVYEKNALFTVWFNCSNWGINSDEIRKRLLEKNLMIGSGSSFYDKNGAMRINLAVPKSTVKKALKIILELRNEII